MRQYLALTIFSFLFVANAFAQIDLDHEFACGTHGRHEHLMRTDATYKTNYLLRMQRMDSLLQIESLHRSVVQAEYTIPVVVHVIHLGEPVGTGSNISDAQILDAINGLNTRYANANGQGEDMDIQFCMATQTPDGCPTNGIVRVDGSGVANYTAEGIEYDGTCGANELAIKNLSRWSVFDYYNIWVVHDICGNYAGYAYYPNGGNLDGTVIGSLYMTTLGKTLAHELGHGLDIRHTFEGDGDGSDCPANGSCTTFGDLICDTPPHKRDDCGMTNPCTSEGEWLNSRYNWMSYCSTPVNLGRFTAGQRTRMQIAMNDYPRIELQSSIGCEPVELPWITSDDDPMCEGELRVLEAEPTGGIFIVLSGPGDIEGDELTATGQGTITIQYTTCLFDVTQQIEAFDTPDPFFVSSADPLCSGASRLLSAEPQGGDFNLISGPASLQGNTIVAEEPGQVEIEYIVTNNGCTNNTFQEFDIVETPMPEITSNASAMCVNEVRVLTGIPGGGEYVVISGPGTIDGNELTANDDGIIVIEYAVEDNECVGITTQAIAVNVSPTASITSSNAQLCNGEQRVLSGLPVGGTFSILSGPGLITADTLTAIDSGDIVVQYTVIQNGCAGTSTQTIHSQASPIASIANTETLICLEQSIALNAVPIGGTLSILSGPGILNGNMLSANAEGNILVGYAVTQNGCTGYAEKQIASVLTPQPFIALDTTSMCSGDTRIVTATPEGGIFNVISGPAVIDSNTLASTGAGLIQLEYVLDLNGCIGVDTQQLISFATPIPVLTITDISLCNHESIQLAGSPVGGLYEIVSGPGSIEGDILTALDTGHIEFTYTVVENNCTGSVQDDVLVLPQPIAEVIVNENILTSTAANVSFQWLRCDAGYEVIPGAVESNYTVTTSGSYALAVQEGFCVDTSECVFVEVTSLVDNDVSQFVIYPNPVEDKLYIKHAGLVSILNVVISDIHGKRVAAYEVVSHDKMELNVRGLAAGVYLLTLETGNRERYQFRFVRI